MLTTNMQPKWTAQRCIKGIDRYRFHHATPLRCVHLPCVSTYEHFAVGAGILVRGYIFTSQSILSPYTAVFLQVTIRSWWLGQLRAATVTGACWRRRPNHGDLLPHSRKDHHINFTLTASKRTPSKHIASLSRHHQFTAVANLKILQPFVRSSPLSYVYRKYMRRNL